MEWIKFTDKHPVENENVLVTDGESIGSAHIQYYGKDNKHFHLVGAAHGGHEWEWNWGQDENVTHWMPLPKLPRIGEKKSNEPQNAALNKAIVGGSFIMSEKEIAIYELKIKQLELLEKMAKIASKKPSKNWVIQMERAGKCIQIAVELRDIQYKINEIKHPTPVYECGGIIGRGKNKISHNVKCLCSWGLETTALSK